MKKLLLPIFIFVITLTCTKEYSGEGTPVVVDTIPNPVDSIPVIDTPKTYTVNYDILIDSFNHKISHIEVQVKRKPEPYFWTYEIINHVDDTISYRYIKSYDVTWIFENNSIGDTAVFGYVIVYPGPVITKPFITDTIIK